MRQKNILQWYDYWLKGVDNGVMDGPAVRIFLMGANRWLEAETWPPPGITYQLVYLRAIRPEPEYRRGIWYGQSWTDRPQHPLP